MKAPVESILNELTERYPVLKDEKEDIIRAYEILKDCYAQGGKLLIGGNGGSAADSGHIVGELMKGFKKKRPLDEKLKDKLRSIDPECGEKLAGTLQRALPAIAVTEHSALNTAFSNDVQGTECFAQQVLGYGREGDVFLGISTSGRSQNVTEAVITAKALGLKTIGLTGGDGGRLKDCCDCTIAVPETETFKIQELHLPVYHALCLMLEETFF